MSNNHVPPNSSGHGKRSDGSVQHNGPRTATSAEAEPVRRVAQVIRFIEFVREDGTVEWVQGDLSSDDSSGLDQSDDDGSGHEESIGAPEQQNGRQMAREPMASGHLRRLEPGNLHGLSYDERFLRSSRNAEEQDRNQHRQGTHMIDPQDSQDPPTGRRQRIHGSSYIEGFNRNRSSRNADEQDGNQHRQGAHMIHSQDSQEPPTGRRQRIHGPSYIDGFNRNRSSRNADEQDRNQNRHGAHADLDEHRDSRHGRQVAVVSPNSYTEKFNQIRFGNPVNRRERVNDYSTRGREGSSRYESNHAEEGIMNHRAAVRNKDGSNFDSHRGRPTENSSVNRSNYAQGFVKKSNRLGHQDEHSNGGRERISRYESNHAKGGIMNHQATVRNNDGSNFDRHRGRPTANNSINRSNYAPGFFINRSSNENEGNRLGYQDEYSNGGRERSSRYESRNNAHRSDGQSGSQSRSESFDAMILEAYRDFALNDAPLPIPPYDNIRRMHQACKEKQEARRARENGELPPYERRYPGITPTPRLEFDFLNKTGPFRRT
ncbi:hypothetical protein B9Z55_025009 [Caenorhabditis nigoni]|nr:hypothetical protein B9Z55_025009 [Caenorhabditis nigoni]